MCRLNSIPQWMACVLLLGLVGREVSAGPRPPGPHDDGRQRTDRFLVVPKEGVDPRALAAWMAGQGLDARPRKSWQGAHHVLSRRDGGDLQQAMRACELSGLIEWVEPDYLIRAARAPDDPRFADGSAWHLENEGQVRGVADADVDAAGAWDLVTDASGVIVAVVDSGILTTHEELAANLWRNPGEIEGNGIDDDRNGIVDDVFGFDALAGTGDPTDKSGHGTHVAGIIGAAGNNGRGLSGIAWNVRLMGLRFIDETLGGSTSDAITCIDYAVAHGARVINASWGSTARSRSLERALLRARNAGVIVVGAAGNEATNIDVTPTYPGAYAADNVVCVTATTRGDGFYAGGNFGSTSVDLGAPGVEILSSWMRNDGDYAVATGTSMATPMVTGAFALMAARHPGADYRTLISALLGAVDPIPALAGKTVTGGRLNVSRAVRALDLATAVASRITLQRPQAGASALAVQGTPGMGYVLESSSGFGTWTPLASGTADAAGSVEFQVPVADQAAGFFRVRQSD